MASQKTGGLAAKRYASALLDIADSQGKTDSVLKDLNELRAMVEGSGELQDFLNSPRLSREQQLTTIQALAKKAKFQAATANFLSLLAQNRRLNMLMAMINMTEIEASNRRGEVAAMVQTAEKLTKAQEKALQDSISKAIGRAVAVQVEVKKDLIGGMVVTVGSQMIDDSVKRKLERLKIAMKSKANSNSGNLSVAS